MSFATFVRPLRSRAAVLIVALSGAGTASASDDPPATAAGPVVVPNAACQACNQVPSLISKCCGKGHEKHCKPYQTTLCPGACFGYFQTQWNRWDDVCSHPYQGIGISDAPRPVTPSTTQPVPLNPPNKVLPETKIPSIDPKKNELPKPNPLPGKN